VTIRPFAREKKRFAQKFTDGQTDGQTTDAARLYKLMEWANNSCPYTRIPAFTNSMYTCISHPCTL